MSFYDIEFTYEQAKRVYEDTHTKFWSNRSREVIYTLYERAKTDYGCTITMHNAMLCILLNFYGYINSLREENGEEPDKMAVALFELLNKHNTSAA